MCCGLAPWHPEEGAYGSVLLTFDTDRSDAPTTAWAQSGPPRRAGRLKWAVPPQRGAAPSQQAWEEHWRRGSMVEVT